MDRGSLRSLLFLVLAFAMLWVPVGQHAFLVPHWMKLGTFMAPFLLFAASFGPADLDLRRDRRWLSLLLLVAYIIHQHEEHWVDLFGNVYAFHGTVNDLLRGAFGATADPLSPEGIFVINTSLVWLVGALAVWRGPRHRFLVLAMAGIVVVNAVSHIVVGAANLAYNPGLLTSLVLFLPLGGYVYVLALRDDATARAEVMASVVWAVLAHVVMVGGLVAGQIYGLFGEPVYFVALVVWSIVPVGLFRRPDAYPRMADGSA